MLVQSQSSRPALVTMRGTMRGFEIVDLKMLMILRPLNSSTLIRALLSWPVGKWAGSLGRLCMIYQALSLLVQAVQLTLQYSW